MPATLHFVDPDSNNRLKIGFSNQLAQQFAYECGFRRLPWMQKAFLQLLDKGFSFQLLQHFITLTSWAPRPSWAYLQAIANSAISNDAYDLDAFLLIPRPSPSQTLPY